MSESGEESASLGAVPMLEYISRELTEAQVCVTKLIRVARRTREDDADMMDALRQVRRQVDAVREELVQVPQNEEVAKGKRAPHAQAQRVVEAEDREEEEDEEFEVAKERKQPKRAKRDEKRVEEKGKKGKEEEEQEEQGSDEEVSNERELKKPKSKGRLIADGVAGRTAGGLLVYFALNEEIVKQNGKELVCPSHDDKGSLMVARRVLSQMDYGSLAVGEQQWYHNQLLNDIVLRFKVNFPVLFSNFGVDMIQTRTTLVNDPAGAALLVDVFAARVVKANLALKVSPSLSAANNTAIMLAAVLHENLSKKKAPGWHEEYEKQLKSIREWCTLSPKTIERSRAAAKLMLRSNVIACLLPSFVMLLSEPIAVLLDDAEHCRQLETVFAEEMGRYAKELEETRLIVIGSPIEERIGGMVEDGSGEQAQRLMQIEQQQQGDAVEKSVPKLVKCRKCKQMIERFVCDVGGKQEHTFCWRCAGYSDRPADELTYPGTELPIHTYVFCQKDLPDLDWCTRPYAAYLKQQQKPNPPLSLPDFVSFVQADECRKLVQTFSDPLCAFTLEPMKPNGWCALLSIAAGLGEQLEVLVARLQEFVADFVKAKGAFVKKPKQFLTLWANLDVKDGKSVQELWSCDDGDLLLPLIADLLNNKTEKGAIQVSIWSVGSGKLERVESYPDGDGVYRRVIDLLQTNVIVPHYDLMRPK